MVINVRMGKDDYAALVTTITSAGLAEVPRDLKCIAFSKPDAAGNKNVHAKTNEQLLNVLLQNRAGPCIHITGEMRALADPFHRRICAELVKRAKAKFTVIYNAPDDSPKLDPVSRWARTWKSKKWADRLSAINLIGDSYVDVRGYNTLNEIQYSVFGNRYTLLQEKHADDGGSSTTLVKRVWLLESEKLNSFLTDRAMAMVGNATDVPEALFKRFSAKVTGLTAQTILKKLAIEGALPVEQAIGPALSAFDTDALSDLEALKAIGFIQHTEVGTVNLTPDGAQYLKALE